MSGEYITLAFAFALCAFALYSLFNNLIKARLIEDTPTSKIRSANQGYIELSGFAHCHDAETVIAPLTGRPCLWYRYRIERYESNGKSSNWRLLEQKTSDNFFCLRDDTGECAVDPRKADVNSLWTKSWRGNTRHPMAGNAGSTSILLNSVSGNYRYTESIIQENDYLYALGMFQSIHAPSAEQQQEQKTKEILNQWKQDYDDLVSRFDQDNNGELDMQEWEQARLQAANQARDYVLDNYDDTPIHILTYSPHRRNPFIISNKDPKQLSRRYRLIAFGMCLLFLASGGFCVHLVVNTAFI